MGFRPGQAKGPSVATPGTAGPAGPTGPTGPTGPPGPPGPGPAADTVTGTLTAGTLPVATAAHIIGDSLVSQAGTVTTVAGTELIVNGTTFSIGPLYVGLGPVIQLDSASGDITTLGGLSIHSTLFVVDASAALAISTAALAITFTTHTMSIPASTSFLVTTPTATLAAPTVTLGSGGVGNANVVLNGYRTSVPAFVTPNKGQISLLDDGYKQSLLVQYFDSTFSAYHEAEIPLTNQYGGVIGAITNGTTIALTGDHSTLLMDCSAGAGTVTFPLASLLAGRIFCVKIKAGSYPVTLTPTGGELIDGAATFVFSGTETAVFFQANGASNNWQVLANYQPGLSGTIRKVTANTSVGPADFTILVDASSGDITVTLALSTLCNGAVYNIKKIAGAHNIILATTGGETIDALAGWTFGGVGESLTLQAASTLPGYVIL